MRFELKVIRNAFVLSGMMFASTYITGTLNYELVKPVIGFFLMYTFTELARAYGLTGKNKKTLKTLVFI